MQAILQPPFLARPSRARNHRVRGLSLIEILVVLAIIALFTSGVAIVAIKLYEDSKRDAAAHDIAELSKAVEVYRVRRHRCPKSTQDLLASGIVSKLRKDPWGSDYVFACPGEHGDFDIASAGKDGELGTDDDIHSWALGSDQSVSR